MISFMPLYIDPGTGSMLFSLFIGIAATATFAFRALFIKLKFILSGGKAEKKASETSIPYVIFSDHKRYWNVFKPICDEFENRKIELVYFTASKDDPVFEEKYNYVKAEFLGEKNKPYIRLNMLNADIVLSTTPGLDVLQWKRSKGVKWYVHVPHAADEMAGYRMFALDHYDAVLATGKNQIDLVNEIEKLRPNIKVKEKTIVGYPVFDSMQKRLEKIRNSEKTNNEKKTILLAPSWGSSGILSLYGEKLLQELINTNYEIIIRPHPQSVISEQNILKPLQEKFSNINWNYENDNFDVLNKADLLITDFSGIIFDYAIIFDKPLIYTEPSGFDTKQYDADWLAEPRWSFKVLPEIGLKLEEENFSKIKEIIKNALNNKALKKGRDEVRNQAWGNRGKAAYLIANYLINKQKSLLEASK